MPVGKGIVLGEAEKVIRVYMTEDGIVHWAGRPKQVVIDAPQCLTVVNGKFLPAHQVGHAIYDTGFRGERT